MKSLSPLETLRLQYQPKLPKLLRQLEGLTFEPMQANRPSISVELAQLFPKTASQSFLTVRATKNQTHNPLRVGVVLSGGQAAGGHNVISGLFDALKKLNPNSQLYGFLNGPGGIIDNKYKELKADTIAAYRNQGGFDMIGSGRTKIETPEQFQAAENAVQALNLDGLVIVGGDDSNTNAALLAEYFIRRNIKTRVIGVPKTIDGDLKNDNIEASFGFDTASKTYSEYIGSVARDALSAAKYYFFIKVMGRSASHIALECALQTHPNLTLIGEEVEAKKQTVRDITIEIADLICERAAKSKDYGIIVIPEGLIEFIPECKTLISELNALVATEVTTEKAQRDQILAKLSAPAAACLQSLPAEIQSQLLLDRDPHGNVKVSQIETERLFIETVKSELVKRQQAGTYKGKFSPLPLFCGYEGRSCMPSNFDAQYCYALGHVAALLIEQGATGYMSSVSHLTQPVDDWKLSGIPLVSMMDLEMRKGKLKPVIRKALVDLAGKPFAQFKEQSKQWRIADDYRYPGPIQFFGPSELIESTTLTLSLESS